MIDNNMPGSFANLNELKSSSSDKTTLPPRTVQILGFLAQAENMKLIERTVDCLDGKRVESNAEHVWEVCMFIFLFQDTFPAGTDILKMMQLALVHDLPEILAGDTYFLDDAGKQTKLERERLASIKLFEPLPSDLREKMHDLFEEYESKATLEAKLVNAVEKLQPIFQILNAGGERFKMHHVTYQAMDNDKRKHMEVDQEILAVYESLMQKLKDYYEVNAPELLR